MIKLGVSERRWATKREPFTIHHLLVARTEEYSLVYYDRGQEFFTSFSRLYLASNISHARVERRCYSDTDASFGLRRLKETDDLDGAIYEVECRIANEIQNELGSWEGPDEEGGCLGDLHELPRDFYFFYGFPFFKKLDLDTRED